MCRSHALRGEAMPTSRADAHWPRQRNTDNPRKPPSMRTGHGTAGIIKGSPIAVNHSPSQRGKAGTLDRDRGQDVDRVDALGAFGGCFRMRDGISRAVSACTIRGKNDVERR